MPIRRNIINNSTGGSSPITINGKTGTTITLNKSDIGLDAVLNAEQVKKTDVGVLVPAIQANGKIRVEETPVIAANLVSVANITERLALSINENLTLCVQGDTQWMWSLNGNESPSTEANWVDCGSTSATVVSVNGATGIVTLTCANLGAVPVNRTINGNALSDDITLTIDEIITLPNDITKYLRGDGSFAIIPTMTGATISSDGVIGLVPKPTINQKELYLKGDGTWSIVQSTGEVVAQNRSYMSVGVSANYTTNVSANDHIKFDTVLSSYGSNITLDINTTYTSTTNVNSIGRFLLKSGSTYRLSAHGFFFASSTNDYNLGWTNADSGAFIGKLSINSSVNSTASYSVNPLYEAIFTPTVDTRVELKMLGDISGTIYDDFQAYIEEISVPANTINTVDYIFARVSTNVTTANTIIPVTPVVGNIEVVNNMFSLIAGKTYELEAFVEFNGNTGSVWAEYVWTNSSGTYLPTGTTGLSVPVQSTSTDSSIPAKTIITPTQNMSVKVMTTGTVDGVVGLALTRSYVKITQIGATAITSVPQSLVDPTKVTKAQRLALTGVEGLEVYQTDESLGKYIYSGGKWCKISNLAYLKANNTSTGNPTADTLLNFSSSVVSNGIKTNIGGGRYKLYPGVYELMGVQTINENGAGIGYKFYNYTTSLYIGEMGNAGDVAGSAGVSSPAFAILECAVDTDIGLRCENDSATVLTGIGSWLKIKQIS